MFSKCLFCHGDLGSNQVIERFPIGRRLAFDEAKGRLWVVCTACARWNLTPIEERWEAIEDCERRFRATHLRLSTEHIGLARLSEGLELIRVGKPQKPELAAWRYSSRFRARRTRALITQGLSYGVLAALAIMSPIQIAQLAANMATGNFGRRRRQGFVFGPQVVARFRDADGRERLINRQHAARVILLPARRDEEWGLLIRYTRWESNPFAREAEIRGEQARALIPNILPVVNYAGAKDTDVKDALGFLDKYKTAAALFNHAAGMASKIGWESEDDKGELANLPTEHRLALEMTANEDTERRALEGELHLLEDAWREAEEIAAISDNLFLPKGISDRLAKLKVRPRSRND